jgi:uncharacterized repeat protein (TIGR03803 family)
VNPKLLFGSLLRISLRKSGCVTVLVYALTMVAGITAHAQTLQVIHSFTGGGDGANPYAGLTMDRAGNFYGTARYGGSGGSGTVFSLSRRGSGWAFDLLYSFTGGSDGAQPASALIMDQAGNLYGTTTLGGVPNCQGFAGCGTVFKLQPPAAPCATPPCAWTETVLHAFTGGEDAAFPTLGSLLFDQTGNLYGTTEDGGGRGGCAGYGCGAVFKLSPSASGWTESVLYSFTGGSDGSQPECRLIFDGVGNLYGTASSGGLQDCQGYPGCGTVFKLSPSESGWTDSTLHSFTGGDDGWTPVGGLVFDQSGNLYGTTASSGQGGGGSVFKLAPSGGNWTRETLHTFTGEDGPEDSLVMDGGGNLYGTTPSDNFYHDAGSVFELLPSGDGGWTYTILYEFLCGRFCIDGAAPYGGVIFDTNGNLYGTTLYDGPGGTSIGNSGHGVVWEITR